MTKTSLDSPGLSFGISFSSVEEIFEEDKTGSSLHPRAKITIADATFKWQLQHCKVAGKCRDGKSLSLLNYIPIDDVPQHLLLQVGNSDEEVAGNENEVMEDGALIELHEENDSTPPPVMEASKMHYCMVEGAAIFCTVCTKCRSKRPYVVRA